MIEIEHVSKRYGALAAVDDVSLTIPTGDVYGVVGQSGAGKSTLARLVNLLERPDSGTVTVDGVELTSLGDADLRAARRKIGMVFQRFNLLGSRTVRGNVELAVELDGTPRAQRRDRAQEMLDLVGLGDRGDAPVHELSGGQQQRVGIARALAARPTVLLSDEATSALDPETTTSILDLYRRINAELGLTVLLITHEMDVVKSICRSAALIERGRIVESGPLTDLIRTPGSRLTAQLFPLGPVPASVGASSAVIDITFAGGSADRPVIAQLARDHGLDVSILGALIEQIGGAQAGRTRIEVPGSAAAAVVADLRAQGLLVEVLKEAV
ncbi:methionine ABC transporter ATP-binding protein [Microbacterium sp. SORGH_AS_0888]|uniref:methionine ABC transporter ATP-binding protein n=1 Tax=Microbacterium sp. SORGH_AS_0888 TaxID=3041791 RepID=UPI0027854E1F|nr:ATP-binding cassette domain-containing protein [Microbacterium sp. SORGH_AS_0888]MDQ1129930.1 D-methionine transport system ATP-binding protein [Microbacterium sp. SORGH_AS_0888]